jgi:hypothetical protein
VHLELGDLICPSPPLSLEQGPRLDRSVPLIGVLLGNGHLDPSLSGDVADVLRSRSCGLSTFRSSRENRLQDTVAAGHVGGPFLPVVGKDGATTVRTDTRAAMHQQGVEQDGIVRRCCR